MKIKNIVILILILPFFSFKSFANKREGKITADLSPIKNYFDHVVIKMTGYAEFGDSVETIDTIKAIGGKFEYHFSVPETRMTTIVLLKNNEEITDLAVKDAALSEEYGYDGEFLVGNEDIKLSCTYPEWLGMPYVQVSSIGLKEHKLYSWLNTHDLNYHYVNKDFIKKHPDSYSVLQAVYFQRGSLQTDDIASMIELFSDELKNSGSYAAIKKYLSKIKMLQKGEFATSFNWFDVNGVAYDFKSVLNGKKYVLVVFWSSDCESCRYEIKFAKNIEQRYGDKVSIVYLSIDTDFQKWKQAVEEEKMTWYNLSGLPNSKKTVAENYYTDYAPEFLLLDTEGKSLIPNSCHLFFEIDSFFKNELNLSK
ncbi:MULTISPECIES: TlpA family protein disulfide reductase [Flavobacterium]|uniref:Thiol-disulfide isomerase or thioredoxin n=1 Tax=Flavobacterium nitrogenifigens TaxID=1617283 RepID=A0A521BLY6_9FLAO|nr:MULTISPECIES: thioredoxin family protein [Flavobacterium]KAF2330875.1 redoxin domain-containing protein [Flavobacterium nitrogenifigens]WDF65536.1 thioredoxin family protein [Flavobacterium sp. KACC 22763]SMO48102.1 Thiol-disulfide isomerase or thioredoxin [Flavobacterium nitrogenifigens]